VLEEFLASKMLEIRVVNPTQTYSSDRLQACFNKNMPIMNRAGYNLSHALCQGTTALGGPG